MKKRWTPALFVLVLATTPRLDAQYPGGRLPPPPYVYGPGYGYYGIRPQWPAYLAADLRAENPPPPQPADDRATLHIVLPSTANNVWIDGEKLPPRETRTRVVQSPPIASGHHYTYTVRASWPGPEGMVTEERRVVVGTHRVTTVDFTRPAPAAAAQ